MNDGQIAATVGSIVFVFIISIIIFGSLHISDSIKRYEKIYSCDELALLGPNDISKGIAYNKKCVYPLFNNTYPDNIQIQQYFTNLDCKTLGIHILKKHFEYDAAKYVYDIKCSTPLENLEMPPIVFDIQEKPNKTVKSQRGKQ